jgi:hypothetical protein
MNVLNEATSREPDVSQLRERAAGVLETALRFIELHGNQLSQCRARILVELEPVERGLSLLSSYQVDDGSFRPTGQVITAPYSEALNRWDPAGAVVGTLEAISVLSDWKRLYESCADRAIEFLGKAQRADGDVRSRPTDKYPRNRLPGGLSRPHPQHQTRDVAGCRRVPGRALVGGNHPQSRLARGRRIRTLFYERVRRRR